MPKLGSPLDQQLTDIVRAWDAKSRKAPSFGNMPQAHMTEQQMRDQALLCLDQGANPHLTLRKKSLLMWAVEAGSAELVQRLLEQGASVDLKEGSTTPLGQALAGFSHRATARAHILSYRDQALRDQMLQKQNAEYDSKLRIVKLVLDHGAKNSGQFDPFFALFAFPEKGEKFLYDAADLLLEAGFDPTNYLSRNSVANPTIVESLKAKKALVDAQKSAQEIIKEAGLDVANPMRGLRKI